MRAQRVREGESRAEMQIVKWTAEGAVKGRTESLPSILRREAYVSCRRYVGISLRAQGDDTCESRWHRGAYMIAPSLTDSIFYESVRDGAFGFTGNKLARRKIC